MLYIIVLKTVYFVKLCRITNILKSLFVKSAYLRLKLTSYFIVLFCNFFVRFFKVAFYLVNSALGLYPIYS